MKRNITEIIEAKQREIAELGVFETVLERLQQDIVFTCEIKTDEEGHWMTDEDGNYIIEREPQKDDWNYDRYTALKSVYDKIEKLIK